MEIGKDTIGKNSVYYGNYKDLAPFLKKVIEFQDKENLDIVTLETPNIRSDDIFKDIIDGKLITHLSYGFVPLQSRNLIVKMYLNEKFSYSDVDELASVSKWERYSDPKLLEVMEENPDDPHYLVRGEGRLLRFPVSGRPINTMAVLRTSGFKTVKLTIDEGKKGYVKIGTKTLFSVNRYSAGMSRGLYYDPDTTGHEYCGTFYYYEPMSYIWLACEESKIIFFRNKVDACIRLYNHIFSIIIGDEKDIDYYDLGAYDTYLKYNKDLNIIDVSLDDFDIMVKNVKDIDLDGSLISVTTQAKRYIKDFSVKILNNFHKEFDMTRNSQDLMNWYIGSKSGVIPIADDYTYQGQYLSDLFYAEEDIFDQFICIFGKSLGIDIIFLEKMAGKTRVVSEILDTRSRKDSIDNLYWQIT